MTRSALIGRGLVVALIVSAVLAPASARSTAATGSATAAQAARVRAQLPATLTNPSGPRPFADPDDLTGLVQTGDLNGDGLRDVLDVRNIDNFNGPSVTTITARVGDTGAAIWHRRILHSDCADLAVDGMKVGPHGRPGVVVTNNCAHGGYRVTALSGRRGRVVWTTTIADVSYEAAPSVGHFLPGPADDFVTNTQIDNSKHTVIQPVVIDGSNGAVRRLPRVRTDRPTGVGYTPPIPARLFTVPDLNGDGLDDLVIAGRQLVAETATSGSVIWRTSSPDLGDVITVTPVGRLGIGAVTNLALGNYQPIPTSAFDKGREPRLQQTLVNGATGRTIWHRFGEVAVRIDRAGPHLVPAVAVIRQYPQLTKSYGGHTVGIVAQAVGLHDKVIWTRSLVRHSKQLVDPGDAAQGFDITDGGDVEPDGAHEIQVSLDGLPGKRGFISGLIDGRTGRLIPNDFGTPADGSFTAAPGTDSIGEGARTKSGNDVSVGARDGLTNHLYFSRTFNIPGGGLALPVAARVTPKCSGIALETFGVGPEFYAMISGSGHVLWKLRFGADQEFGGHLVRGTPSKRYCSK